MSTIGYINVSLEISGGLMSLVFILCVYITRRKWETLGQLYMRMLICNTALLFCDAAAWLFKGRPGRFSCYAVHVSNFLVYTLGYVILAFFTHYLVHFLMVKKAPVPKKILPAMFSIMAAAMVLTVISQFNGMYYIINEQNIYQRQSMFWLSQLFGMIGLILNGFLLIHCRRWLSRREIFTFSIYILLPLLSLLFQMFFYSIAVLYLATSICLLYCYLNIQMEISQEAAKRELELAESRIDIMLSQIQPHFIYNTMTAIEYLCNRDGAKEAGKVVRDFSKYLRKNLDSLNRKQPIPFSSELEHTKLYLSIEQMQYEERLQVEFDIQAANLPCRRSRSSPLWKTL